MLRSPRLHSRVSSDFPRPCVTSTHRLQGSWWSIPVDTGCYGTERSWPLLSTQYAEQGSFTPEKRLKVLDFPQPTTQKEMLQFIGLANYCRDHVPNMTEMVKPLRDMIPLVIWTTNKKLCSVQALPTSYFELSGTLLPRGHCHTYPPNCCFRLRYRWLPLHGN